MECDYLNGGKLKTVLYVLTPWYGKNAEWSYTSPKLISRAGALSRSTERLVQVDSRKGRKYFSLAVSLCSLQNKLFKAIKKTNSQTLYMAVD